MSEQSWTSQEADVPGYGTVWYDQNAIANIFQFQKDAW